MSSSAHPVKLVIIYGPSAAGKYTIGKVIAEQTGFRLFHNHLTVPAARALFPDYADPAVRPQYAAALQGMRLAALSTAAQAGVDTVFTMLYRGASDNRFIQDVVDMVQANGGTTSFVQLDAPDAVLMERVGNASRHDLRLGKPTDPARLAYVLRTEDVRAQVPFDGVLHIDTATCSADEAAQQVVRHFELGLRS